MTNPLPCELNPRVIERIAEAATLKVPGCIRLDAKLAGLAGRSLPRFNAVIYQTSGSVSIEAIVAVSYPSPVAAVTDAVRAAVITQVRTLTDLEVTRVTIIVADSQYDWATGVVTVDDVAEHSPVLVPTPVTIHSSSKTLTPVIVSTTRPVRASVRSPEPQPLMDVHKPRQQPLMDVHKPRQQPLMDVHIPKQQPLMDVHIPKQQPLMDVHIPKQQPLMDVHIPKQQPPKPIAVPPQRLVPVTVPPQRQAVEPHAPAPIAIYPIRVTPVVQNHARQY